MSSCYKERHWNEYKQEAYESIIRRGMLNSRNEGNCQVLLCIEYS